MRTHASTQTYIHTGIPTRDALVVSLEKRLEFRTRSETAERLEDVDRALLVTGTNSIGDVGDIYGAAEEPEVLLNATTIKTKATVTDGLHHDDLVRTTLGLHLIAQAELLQL